MTPRLAGDSGLLRPAFMPLDSDVADGQLGWLLEPFERGLRDRLLQMRKGSRQFCDDLVARETSGLEPLDRLAFFRINAGTHRRRRPGQCGEEVVIACNMGEHLPDRTPGGICREIPERAKTLLAFDATPVC